MRQTSNLVVFAFIGLCGLLAYLRLAPHRVSPTGGGATPSSWLQPAAGNTVEILFSSSDGKKEWIDAVTESFQRTHPNVDGHPIHVTVNHMRSGESRQKILDGKEKPTIWSPAGSSWVTLINEDWKLREKKPFLTEVRPTVRTGLVIAMWEPMAQALGWPG